METFKTQYSVKKISPPVAWKENLAKGAGGFALILLALLALPFVLILFLWIQYRRFFSKKNTRPASFPEYEWTTFVDNQHLKLQRKMNAGLEAMAEKDPILAEALEFEEFIAYRVRSVPEMPALNALYFDYCFEELYHGVFLRGLSPSEKRAKDPIYFLDYNEKKLQKVAEIPANSGIEMEVSRKRELLILGYTDEEEFRLVVWR